MNSTRCAATNKTPILIWQDILEDFEAGISLVGRRSNLVGRVGAHNMATVVSKMANAGAQCEHWPSRKCRQVFPA